MSEEWQLLLSARVMVFVLDQPQRTRRRLLDLLESLRLHPMLCDDDLPRHDSRGRLNHLRFDGDFAILFWIDHAEKAVQVLEIGWQ